METQTDNPETASVETPTAGTVAPESANTTTTQTPAPSGATKPAPTVPAEALTEWQSRAQQREAELTRQANEARAAAERARLQAEQLQLAQMDDEQKAAYYQQQNAAIIQQQQAQAQAQAEWQHWNDQAAGLFQDAGVNPRDPEVMKYFKDELAQGATAQGFAAVSRRLLKYQSEQIAKTKAEATALAKRAATTALNDAGVTVTSSGTGEGSTGDRTQAIRKLQEDVQNAIAKREGHGLKPSQHADFQARAVKLGLTTYL